MVDIDCYAIVERYLADCNSVKLNNGMPTEKLTSKFIRRIGPEEQLLIREYIHSLIDLKFSETDFGHACIVSDLKFQSEIMLSVYSWSDKVALSYNNLKSVLTQ